MIIFKNKQKFLQKTIAVNIRKNRISVLKEMKKEILSRKSTIKLKLSLKNTGK
jgi:hypothetical protein